MKNSKIHSMYSESMIRDLLSKEYEEGYKKSGYQSVSSIEKQIEKLQKEHEEWISECFINRKADRKITEGT